MSPPSPPISSSSPPRSVDDLAEIGTGEHVVAAGRTAGEAVDRNIFGIEIGERDLSIVEHEQFDGRMLAAITNILPLDDQFLTGRGNREDEVERRARDGYVGEVQAGEDDPVGAPSSYTVSLPLPAPK